MSEKQTGGRAFPRVSHPSEPPTFGMTLRDYFAAQVLSGLLAAEANPNASGFPNGEPNQAEVFANHAYYIADAMLAERDKSAPPEPPPASDDFGTEIRTGGWRKKEQL